MPANRNNATVPGPETTTDQRRQTHYPASQSSELKFIQQKFGTFFANFRFSDIFSARHHTHDFRECRAEYINARLRLVVFFFAIAVPGYILVDYFTLSRDHFQGIALARCVLGVMHVFIGMTAMRKLSLFQVNTLLALDVLVTALFYVATILILQSGTSEPLPVGYEFMPFMMVVMIGLFPLTLVCSSLVMLLVLVPYVILQLWLGSMDSQESFNMFFLFLIFMVLVLWLQSGQLVMLLRLYRESTRDLLTGLINRRVLLRCLEDEVARNRSTGRVFSIMMLDLDRFKRINDNYGHFTGDLVLKEAARLLENELRRSDIIARFGGEEFIAILPGLTGEEAVSVANRICAACTETSVCNPDGEEITFTTSIGIAEYLPGEPFEETLKRADDALYGAKEGGRNRVIYEPV